MANIQTQCPNCQSIYPIPDQQLNNPTAKARCPNCQTVFLVNDNRHTQVSDQTSSPSDVSVNAGNQTNASTDDDIFGSVDDMSNWLEQQSSGSPSPIEASKPANTQPNIPISQDKGMKDSGIKDEDWLGDMISNAEDTRAISEIKHQPHNIISQDEEIVKVQSDGLKSLMDNYGVASLQEKRANNPLSRNERINKMRNRLLPDPNTTQAYQQKSDPVASVLWLVGCLLLIGLLVAQYATFNSTALVKDPKHSDKLITVCQILSCGLPSADIDALKVSRVQYRASQVQSANSHTDIVASVMNQSQKTQLMPNLKVSINGKDGIIGEFVATPKDYLVVEQEQISTAQYKPFMFTVAVNSNDISSINVAPFY